MLTFLHRRIIIMSFLLNFLWNRNIISAQYYPWWHGLKRFIVVSFHFLRSNFLAKWSREEEGGGGVNISWMDMCCCFCTSCNVPFWWPKTDMRIDSRYVFFLSFDNSQSKLCLECLYLYIACVKCVGRRDGLRSLLGYISSYQPFPNRNKKLERVLKFWMGLPKQSIGSEHVNTFVFLL